MKISELKQFFVKAKMRNPYCAEEYQTAIDALDELEGYRASMLSPGRVEEMKEQIFELSVENNKLHKELLLIKGEGNK